MLSNHDTKNNQAGRGAIFSAWQWLAAQFSRALRQARRRSILSDVATRLAARGVPSTGYREADEYMPGEIHITHDVHVRVELNTMCALAYEGDMIKYFPDRAHGDLAALMQDIQEARAFVVACHKEYRR